METGWGHYYVLLLAAVFATLIPFFFFVIGRGGQIAPGQASPPIGLVGRVNTRFFLAMNPALLVAALVLCLAPCVVASQVSPKLRLVALAGIGGFAFLSMAYCVRKGDLSWIRSFQVVTKEREPE